MFRPLGDVLTPQQAVAQGRAAVLALLNTVTADGSSDFAYTPELTAKRAPLLQALANAATVDAATSVASQISVGGAETPALAAAVSNYVSALIDATGYTAQGIAPGVDTTALRNQALNTADASLAREAQGQINQLLVAINDVSQEYTDAQRAIQAALAPVIASEESRLSAFTDPAEISAESARSLTIIDQAALDSYRRYLAAVPGSLAQTTLAATVQQASDSGTVPPAALDAAAAAIHPATFAADATTADAGGATATPPNTGASDTPQSAGFPVLLGLGLLAAVVAVVMGGGHGQRRQAHA